MTIDNSVACVAVYVHYFNHVLYIIFDIFL